MNPRRAGRGWGLPRPASPGTTGQRDRSDLKGRVSSCRCDHHPLTLAMARVLVPARVLPTPPGLPGPLIRAVPMPADRLPQGSKLRVTGLGLAAATRRPGESPILDHKLRRKANGRKDFHRELAVRRLGPRSLAAAASVRVRPAGARRGRAGHQLGFQYCHFFSSHDSTTLLFAFRYPGRDPIIACHGGAPGPLAESLSGPPGAEDLRINMREQNQDTKYSACAPRSTDLSIVAPTH